MNWRLSMLAFLVWGLAAGHPALAQEADAPEESGLDLSLRSGYAFISGIPNSLLYGMIPVRLEGRYLFDSHRALGLFLQYGHGLTHQDAGCLVADSCAAADYLFGIDLSYRNSPIGRVTPWQALAIGYEVLHVGTTSYRGWQYAELQVGGDVALGQSLLLGPFGSAAIADFGTVSTTGGSDYDLSGPGLHYWLQVGLRVTLGI